MNGISAFLRASHEGMERLDADHTPALDLVLMCVTLLIRHCIDGENKLT